MKKRLFSLVVLSTMMAAVEARADEPPTSLLAMRPAPPALAAIQPSDAELVAATSRRSLSDEELGLSGNPEFRSARGMRLAGVIMTAASLTGATVLGALAIHFAMGPKDKEETGIVSGVFGALTGLALLPALAGVPLWIAGQRTMTRMREQRRQPVPQVSIAAGPGSAAIGVRWQF